MPHSEPLRETRTLEVLGVKNDPQGEVIPLSHLDCINVKLYVPITSTYELKGDADKATIIANICEGLQKTMTEYRFLAGHVKVDGQGQFFVKRSAGRANFIVHIQHLEHTDFPSYHELEKREFPFSELNAQHLPPGFDARADPTTKPDEGFPALLTQLNFIRGGLVIGTAMHHQCVDATGVDVVIARWAANTRALFTNTPPPPFDPSCLDRSLINSTTPLRPDQILEAESQINCLRRTTPPVPELTPTTAKEPQPPRPAKVEFGQTIFHFPASKLAKLKASLSTCTTAEEEDQQQQQRQQWISTNDCLTALLWRAVTRSRLPRLGLSAADGRSTVSMMMAVDVRPHHAPRPLPPTYPGNAVMAARFTDTVSNLLLLHSPSSSSSSSPDDPPTRALAPIARTVRAAVTDARSPCAARLVKDYVAAFPDRGAALRYDFGELFGLDTRLSNWAALGAYRTHDFGFGGLRALRLVSGVMDGLVFVLPRRVGRRKGGGGGRGGDDEDDDEGTEVFLALERSDMERMREDEELLRWGEVRAC